MNLHKVDWKIQCLLSVEICLNSVLRNGLITEKMYRRGHKILGNKIRKLEALKKL